MLLVLVLLVLVLVLVLLLLPSGPGMPLLLPLHCISPLTRLKLDDRRRPAECSRW
jgi:hypothetical protein